MMAQRKLSLYNKKRDFKKTAEPSGKVSRTKGGNSFLIQKHAATRLHYDFRLELDGVLKSWAVTRGPSLDPADKRLAVEVEDHPVSYGGFEGIIPKGEYGGGTVMMWDEGTWEPLGDPAKDLKAGNLKFKLHGKRLRGEWVLVRMKPRDEKDRGRNNWLLIKHHDKYAKAGQGEKFLEKNATSIVSKRSMERIAADADRKWKSTPNKGSTAGASPPMGKEAKKATAKPARIKKNAKVKLPPFIPPQLATLSTEMPIGGDWVHEVKFDGYRVLAYINGGEVHMFTRNGLDWTEKFGHIPETLAGMDVEGAILDGELVSLNEKKVSSFAALKKGLSGDTENLAYYAFDLLNLNGKDLRKLPLTERKKLLAPLLTKQLAKGAVFLSEHFQSRDDTFYRKACQIGLEGVISKRADAPYRSGRGGDWLKSKCNKRQEFVIGGYTDSSTGLPTIGSLLLGYYEGKDFVYAGRVGTGFDQKTARELYQTLKKLKRSDMPYTKYSDGGRRGPGWKRGVHWAEPKLVCEVEFTEWTEDGSLRHPSFQGLREDKPAKTITRDVALPPKQAAKKEPEPEPVKKPRQAAARNRTTPAVKSNVPEVNLSNPDKVLWPDVGYTKQDLADYYDAVAKWMLPYVAKRPLSLVRCPGGSKKPCFFQRHIGQYLPPSVDGIKIYKGEEPYVAIHDAEGLRGLTQMGVLEVHNWGSTMPTWDKPDMIVFDLDPDPSVTFVQVKQAAIDVRDRLKKLKLKSFIKTTGGKGLHVVVPFTPEHDWATIKEWARAFAELMAQEHPAKYTTNIRKAARKGRIFIDYLRNGETATAIAPYSSRAREGAPVAVPIDWKELPKVKAGNQWNIKTLPKRLKAQRSDPWKDFLKTKQSLPVPKTPR